MEYLSHEEILVLHSKIIDATGGLHGIRDLHLFASIIEKPKMAFGGDDLYKDIFTKASVYLESFAKYHVFLDGNKRTAFVASARFLSVNGYFIKAENAEVVDFMVSVVEKKLEIADIARWLKMNSKKISK